MTVELLFFAQLKEALGRSHEVLEVAEGQTVDDVVGLLRDRSEWRSVASLPLAFAVDERIVGGDHELRDGDRLALLTPLSGG
jgi:molybdopterin converting factor small subunit